MATPIGGTAPGPVPGLVPGPVLGIETSCDETAAALLDADGTVLAEALFSQHAEHLPYAGVVPEIAARAHLARLPAMVGQVLAGQPAPAAVAATVGPGLIGGLVVGAGYGKGFALARGLPFLGINHLEAHALSARLPALGDPPAFPYLTLLVSGGHCLLAETRGPGDHSLIGTTRDDAVGEAFDKVAKMLGLGYPGGPRIDRLAAIGDASRVPFLAPMASTKTLEFSFSGLKTQVAQHLEANGRPHDDAALADLCASFQAAVTSVLSRKLVEAAVREKVSSVVLGGGVAANRELRARTQALAEARGLRAFVPSLASCTDNAAMIAYAGAMRALRGERDGLDLVATSATVLPRETRKGRGPRA
jgi:N6-L-threonylcarbamoyladenine synthase